MSEAGVFEYAMAGHLNFFIPFLHGLHLDSLGPKSFEVDKEMATDFNFP